MDEVAEAAREVVVKLAPCLRTVTMWGMLWFGGKDFVVPVGAFTRHAGVEFWRGASLSDPHGLLEGTGKNLRHVKLRTVAETRAPAFISRIREAVRLDSGSEKRTR